MKNAAIISLFLALNIFVMKAQRDSVMISGVIYDYETQQTLKNASFKHNGEFIDVSEDGRFQIYVKANDSLAFKYTGYDDYNFVVPENLTNVSYLSGIFLNRMSIDESETIFVPREYKVESLAAYDPTEQQQLLENAKRNVSVAAYQATQPYEWDAQENAKNAIAQKDLDIEYKGAIKPQYIVGVNASTSIQNFSDDLHLNKQGEKGYPHISPISPKEEYYIQSLFDAQVAEGK